MAKQNHSRKKHTALRKRNLRNAIGAVRSKKRLHRNAASAPPSTAISPAHHVVMADVAKLGLAAIGGSVACALVEREEWLPPWIATGLMTVTGLGLAAVGSEAQKMVGYGLVGGSVIQYLGAEILGNHDEPKRNDAHKPDESAPPSTPTKEVAKPAPDTHRQASFEGFGLPPGALEAAYQRARERLAMEHAADVAA